MCVWGGNLRYDLFSEGIRTVWSILKRKQNQYRSTLISARCCTEKGKKSNICYNYVQWWNGKYANNKWIDVKSPQRNQICLKGTIHKFYSWKMQYLKGREFSKQNGDSKKRIDNLANKEFLTLLSCILCFCLFVYFVGRGSPSLAVLRIYCWPCSGNHMWCLGSNQRLSFMTPVLSL